ncbi:hypothetical protein AARAC_010525 [Aspergillus arachidicola]|uniref:Apple domain-containing protein n=1 Tax=Aspergillus arachidicola TaxID=656916 RepID=A0A2G7FMY0_9EURO|nr:hypothetical protein AARAC_010525 [Aspergillus arachidicola]
MLYKSALVLLSLSLLSSAQQGPTCLSPTTAGSASNKATCCPSSNSVGEESVDGTIYEYKCGHYADNLISQKGQYSPNAHDCARKCAAQATSNTPCHAAIWTAESNQPDIGICYLSQAGFTEKADPSGKWLLLVRTDRTGSECQQAIDDAVAVNQGACDQELAKKDQEKLDAVAVNQQACQKSLEKKDQEKTQAVDNEKAACTRAVNTAKSDCTKQSNGRNDVLGKRNYQVYYQKHHRNKEKQVMLKTPSRHLCWEACALDSACLSAIWQNNGLCWKNYFKVTTANLYNHGAIDTAIFW